jgi:very-short-patch-repair endonuclease
LERWTLALLREAGLPRPILQKTYRDGTRIVARVDFQIGDLVIEVCGHGFHSTRRQLQADEQRRTELMRRGLRVVVFRYEDVRDRPGWVTAQLHALLSGTLSA